MVVALQDHQTKVRRTTPLVPFGGIREDTIYATIKAHQTGKKKKPPMWRLFVAIR